MRKLLLCIIAVILALFYFQPSASAILKGGTFQICHSNTDGTYAPVAILFSTAGAASRLTDATGYSHINDTDSDLWPATTYSDQYTQTNIPASHGYMHTVQKLVWVTVNRVRKQVLMWVTEPDPAKVAIWNAGCVT